MWWCLRREKGYQQGREIKSGEVEKMLVLLIACFELCFPDSLLYPSEKNRWGGGVVDTFA